MSVRGQLEVLPSPEREFLEKHLRQNIENIQPSWEIKTSTLGGRGLFASRPIKKGTLIFMNRPLVVAPRGDSVGMTYCSTCYNVTKCYPCIECSLLICSEQCNTSPHHAKECSFIVNNWTLKPKCKSDPFALAQILVYLRFLLLTEEQLMITKILQKDVNSKCRELEQLCSIYVIPEEQLQVMNTMSSVLKINSFRISNNPQKKRIPLRGLYPLSAFLNHSCLPNTRNVFMEDYTMAVYASQDIETGDEIVSCYTGLLWCTPARRCQLFKTKMFWCKCSRCADPSELGTGLSKLNCFAEGCTGALLPVMPLDPSTEWRCDKCGTTHCNDRVSTVQSVLGSLVGTLDLDGQLQLEPPVLKRLASFVPYSSHIFVDMQHRLAMKIGMSTELKTNELSESRLALKESLCRGVLRVVAALGLGDAHHRGLLLYHLHATLAERARRCPDLYEDLKPEIESTIEQAYNILRDDISAPPDLELRRRYLGPGSDKPHEERFFILDS
ncbi:SET domain-containing protein SmydA-8-like isoform X1 [Pectinophora gossypiella]|uniref:SET domain-containing protein SmydA-8-like isoform X1 n=1 Tax=Pectinophora gossypiella TaxID=13191 RepID=UPI00214F421C|nr:SET domain-containing protein SmydA-8-like isoform X1 [Pectinophora gossypiella]